ncbi:MAG: RIP metalloprotease RseP [Ignavibacteria bacterium]|nr:RIP metalloprotease RseP [Ignavibacteria bacterium]
MEFLEVAFYFIVTLGVLVFVHELGHFLAAKATGMRVDRFSIGFPPRAFGKKIGDTDYCVSWIPIGGYVKIAGMIDESFDTDHLNSPPQPWEFRSKPVWQRTIVISAGVIMNILLAVFIFWGINYAQGKIIRETTEIGYVAEESPAEVAGLQSGDKILRINGSPVEKWSDILNLIYIENLGDDINFVILRNGVELQKQLSRSSIPEPTEISFGVVPAQTEIVVNAVEPGKPAEKVGLKPMDVIVSLNGTPIRFDSKIKDIIQGNAGRPIEIQWKRNGELISGTITPTQDGLIGIGYGARYIGPTTRMEYTLFEAFPEGVKDLVSMSGLFARQLWQLITGKAAFSQSVGGPIKIAQMATQSAELGLVSYFGFMALLSISLALLNILPFPALDGGHLVFLVYEAIFRREIPVKIRMALQQAGLFLLLAFMVFVVINDIINF